MTKKQKIHIKGHITFAVRKVMEAKEIYKTTVQEIRNATHDSIIWVIEHPEKVEEWNELTAELEE